MPSDSNGNFSLVSSYFVQNGDTVLPSQHNPVLEDLAQGLTNRLMKDGRTVWTGDMKAGGFRVTGMGPGQSDSDAATVGQLIPDDAFSMVVADRAALKATDTTRYGMAYLADTAQRMKWVGSDLSSIIAPDSITSTAVDDTTDTITAAGHGLRTGQAVFPTTTVNGVTADTIYHAVVPLVKALEYDGETVDFTVGQTLEGGTSGATATILKVDDDGSGSRGILWLSNISGTFQDDEALSDGAGGSATARNTVYDTVNTDAFQLATSYENAMDGTEVDLTGTTNFTVKRHIDPREGVYVISDGDALDGSDGAWVAQYEGCVNTRWTGAVCNADRTAGTGTDDTGAIQAALNLASALELDTHQDGMSIIEYPLYVRNQRLRGTNMQAGLLLKGDHDAIVLTGLGDSSSNYHQFGVSGLEIRADGTQTGASKPAKSSCGIRLGDRTANGDDRLCAHFHVSDINFTTLDNATNSSADAIVFEDDGFVDTAFAFIGDIERIHVYRWRYPFYGVRHVNNIVIKGYRITRCTREFALGDARAVLIEGLEIGSNEFRGMSLFGCFGVTIMEPYLENNNRNAALNGQYDILIDARETAGAYRDETEGGLRIIGGWCIKGGSGNSTAGIRWRSGSNVLIDGMTIEGHDYSILIADDVNNYGEIRRLNSDNTPILPAGNSNIIIEMAGQHTLTKRGSASVGGGGTQSVTFANAFPNNIQSINLTAASGNPRICTASGVSTSGFTVNVFNDAGAAAAATVYWEAIGN